MKGAPTPDAARRLSSLWAQHARDVTELEALRRSGERAAAEHEAWWRERQRAEDARNQERQTR